MRKSQVSAVANKIKESALRQALFVLKTSFYYLKLTKNVKNAIFYSFKEFIKIVRDLYAEVF